MNEARTGPADDRILGDRRITAEIDRLAARATALHPAWTNASKRAVIIMNYGLYLSANGISSSQHRMNVLANNLANANTTGFKPSSVVLGERAREPQRLDTLTNSRQLLAQLGGGTEIAYSGLDLRQGSIERTGLRTDSPWGDSSAGRRPPTPAC